jgi:hypothetical protein
VIPMLSARVATTAAANPGDFRNCLHAYFQSANMWFSCKQKMAVGGGTPYASQPQLQDQSRGLKQERLRDSL